MNNYTVVLQYPESLTDGDMQTYLAHVQALTAKDAITAAQLEAWEPDIGTDPDEYVALFVTMGHHADLSGAP